MDDFVSDLCQGEIELVKAALQAAVDGDFFPDWEFETLMGVDRDTARQVAMEWPNRPGSFHEFVCTVVNSLNNLLGYPHGRGDKLDDYVPGGRTAIAATLKNLGDIGVYIPHK